MRAHLDARGGPLCHTPGTCELTGDRAAVTCSRCSRRLSRLAYSEGWKADERAHERRAAARADALGFADLRAMFPDDAYGHYHRNMLDATIRYLTDERTPIVSLPNDTITPNPER